MTRRETVTVVEATEPGAAARPAVRGLRRCGTTQMRDYAASGNNGRAEIGLTFTTFAIPRPGLWQRCHDRTRTPAKTRAGTITKEKWWVRWHGV